MFTRRRSGEVSKMKREDYKSATSTVRRTDTDVHMYLSEVERSLCKVLTRVEIAGKTGNTVPVLLSHSQVQRSGGLSD